MKMIDLTPIIQAVIMLAAVLIVYRVIPYIKSKTTETQMNALVTAAKIGMKAAEQIYEHGDNSNKLKHAIDFVEKYLRSKGYKIDVLLIRDAVESALREAKDEKDKNILEVSEGILAGELVEVDVDEPNKTKESA